MEIDYKSDIILENKRLILSPLGYEHLSVLSKISVEEPDLLKYSPSHFGTEEMMKQYIDRELVLREEGLKYSFVIFDKQSSDFAGCTSYMNLSEYDMRLEIGSTWISKKFHRTGLNRNCKFLMMRYAFEVLGIERLEFKTDSRNIQSQKAIESIGGIKEGILRSHMLLSDGHRRDTIYYSVLKEEWPHIKNTVFKDMS